MAYTATDVVANLPAQILEVLRDQRMSLSQVSTYFSVKYRSSLHERIKGSNAANLKEYLEGLDNLFEVQGDFVKARPKDIAQSGNSQKAAISTIRYAHISKGIQNILNDTHTKSMAITDLEAAFKIKFGVNLGSIIGMPTVEYLQRKANVFEISGNTVLLQSAFQKEMELTTDMEKSKGNLSPIAEEDKSEKPAKARQAWADLPVIPDPSELPKECNSSEQKNTQAKQKTPHEQKESARALDGLMNSIRGVAGTASVTKDSTSATSAEIPTQTTSTGKTQEEGAPKEKKCENLPLFAVDELVRIFEEHSEGPIMHSSVLCSLFMQQLGASVTEISGKKPMELFRQHPQAFIWLSSGNVALSKYREDKAVQHELRLLEDQPKSVRVKAAAAEAALPVPEMVTEDDVVNYMIGLLQENEDRDSIYISALCGRFMQRFRKPVTEIVGCKPTDFLKKYKDVFYLEKGGHVKLVNGSQALLTGATEAPSSSDFTKGSSTRKETSLPDKAPLSAVQSEPAVSSPVVQSAQVVVPLPVRPWRQSVPESDKENALTHQRIDSEVHQKVDDFCTRLRKQLFFRVTEVSSESPKEAPLSTQGRPAKIPVTVKVTNLPKEMEAQWLPQLLGGLEQVLKLKFALEVDEVTLKGDAVHCRLRNFSIDLFLRLVVV